jgi:hypothetical protein
MAAQLLTQTKVVALILANQEIIVGSCGVTRIEEYADEGINEYVIYGEERVIGAVPFAMAVSLRQPVDGSSLWLYNEDGRRCPVMSSDWPDESDCCTVDKLRLAFWIGKPVESADIGVFEQNGGKSFEIESDFKVRSDVNGIWVKGDFNEG